MEKYRNLEERLDTLKAISPNGGEYFRLFCAVFEEYEEAYKGQPDAVHFCFQNGELSSEADEIIHYLESSIEAGVTIESVELALGDIYSYLSEHRPVTLECLKSVFEHFDISQQRSAEIKKLHIWIDNRNLDYRELRFFLKNWV